MIRKKSGKHPVANSFSLRTDAGQSRVHSQVGGVLLFPSGPCLLQTSTKSSSRFSSDKNRVCLPDVLCNKFRGGEKKIGINEVELFNSRLKNVSLCHFFAPRTSN